MSRVGTWGTRSVLVAGLLAGALIGTPLGGSAGAAPADPVGVRSVAGDVHGHHGERHGRTWDERHGCGVDRFGYRGCDQNFGDPYPEEWDWQQQQGLAPNPLGSLVS